MDQNSSRGVVAEFKEFISTGNLLQIAVAFVMGVAIATVITSFVENIFNGILAAIIGSDGGGLRGRFAIADGNIRIGAFLNDIITFVVLALVVFFIVKAANKFLKTAMRNTVPPDVVLLTEIRDLLRQSR